MSQFLQNISTGVCTGSSNYFQQLVIGWQFHSKMFNVSSRTDGTETFHCFHTLPSLCTTRTDGVQPMTFWSDVSLYRNAVRFKFEIMALIHIAHLHETIPGIYSSSNVRSKKSCKTGVRREKWKPRFKRIEKMCDQRWCLKFSKDLFRYRKRCQRGLGQHFKKRSVRDTFRCGGRHTDWSSKAYKWQFVGQNIYNQWRFPSGADCRTSTIDLHER